MRGIFVVFSHYKHYNADSQRIVFAFFFRYKGEYPYIVVFSIIEK